MATTAIQLNLPDDRQQDGPGKISDDVNLLKAGIAKTADITSQSLADLTAQLLALQAQATAQANAITVLQGGTVTTPTGKYDLALDSITLTPANPVEGQAVIFTAVVKNVGTAAKPAGVTTQVTFAVDQNPFNQSQSAAYTNAIAAGESVTLSAAGGSNGANSYTAVKGDHNVVATTTDVVNGGRDAVDNNSKSLAFTVTGVSTGGPSTGSTPDSGYNSDGIGFSNVTVGAATVNDQTAVTVSETVFFDATRTTTQTLEYGFSVRQVNDSGTVISPDNGDLDLALTAFETTSSWTNSRKTITGSRVYPAGRYSITPFYRLQGSSTYVKFAAQTKYVAVTATATTPATPDPGTGTTPGAVTGTWLTGSSGEMTAGGQFGNWRGLKDTVASHWAENSEDFPGLKAGGEFGNWTGSMIIAIGGIPDGGNWSAAASGSYDTHWTNQANALKTQWTRISRGTLFISFCHELNGNWYTWGNISSGNEATVATAIARARGIFKGIFAAAKFGIVLNRESTTSLDWRKIIPGYTAGTTTSLDFLGVDWYNQYPPLSSSTQWADISNQKDGTGAPKGIEQHRLFAQKMGVPLVIQEWGGNADNGDYTDYITQMFNFFKSNAGTGAGNVIAEAYFNVLVPGQSYRFFLYNDGRATRLPNSAAKYKQLWSSLAAS